VGRAERQALKRASRQPLAGVRHPVPSIVVFAVVASPTFIERERICAGSCHPDHFHDERSPRFAVFDCPAVQGNPTLCRASPSVRDVARMSFGRDSEPRRRGGVRIEMKIACVPYPAEPA
jgi:hypothetical protein